METDVLIIHTANECHAEYSETGWNGATRVDFYKKKKKWYDDAASDALSESPSRRVVFGLNADRAGDGDYLLVFNDRGEIVAFIRRPGSDAFVLIR